MQFRWFLLSTALLLPACGSEEGTVTTVPLVIAAPGGLRVGAGCDRAVLQWNPVPAADGYAVYLASQPGVGPSTYASLSGGQRLTTSASPLSIAPLQHGLTWYFTVAALQSGFEGAISAEISTAVPGVVADGPVGSLHSITGELRGLVHDPARRRVYATNETKDRLEILDLDSNALLAPLPLGDAPWGLDLTPDGNTLLVCLSGENRIARVDLTPTLPSVAGFITVPLDSSGADRPRELACASNGRAFIGCVDSGTGHVILRQLMLSTLAITERADLAAGQIPDPTPIQASGNRDRVVFAKGDLSLEFFYYDAPTDAFVGPGWFQGNVAHLSSNADGTRFAVGNGPTLLGDDLRSHGWLMIGRQRMALHPTRPLGLSTIGNLLTIVDLDRMVEVFSFPTASHNMTRIICSADGAEAYAINRDGLGRIPLDIPRPPQLQTPVGLSASPGQTASYTVAAFDPNGDAINYCAENLPANASFDPVTRRLTFAPDATQAGQTFNGIRLYAGDASSASQYTMSLTAGPVTTHPYRVYGLQTFLQTPQLAYDPVRNRLYAANSFRGEICILDLATGTLLPPLVTGPGSSSLDLNAASSKLVVCTASTGFIVVVDLSVDPPTVARIPVPPGSSGAQQHPLEVAVAANGKALFSTADSAGADGRLCELNLATNAISVRGDVPGGAMTGIPRLRASGDRSVVVVSVSNSTAGFRYVSGTDSFGPLSAFASLSITFDVNHDGSRILATTPTTYYDGSFASLGAVAGPSLRAGLRQGFTDAGFRLAFSPTNAIEVVDLSTFSVTGSFLPGVGASGVLRTDPSGGLLFVPAEAGFSVVDLP